MRLCACVMVPHLLHSNGVVAMQAYVKELNHTNKGGVDRNDESVNT